MGIERSRRRVGSARLATAARRLLDASTLCAIATVSPGSRAHVNTAYFAWSRAFDIVWLSEPRAQHSRNLRENGIVAIAVYDSTQTWGRQDRGIQLFGTAQETDAAAAKDAEPIYAKRFPEYDPGEYTAYRLYLFRPRRVKLFDERDLGAGTFVTARVTGEGTLTWERTDLYEARA